MSKSAASHSDPHEHHVARARRHASAESHVAVHDEAVAFLDHAAEIGHGADHGPPSDADVAALLARLGLTGDEIRTALSAPAITPEQAAEALKVNVASAARAFPPSVTAALATPGSPIGLGAIQPADLVAAAARATTIAAAAAKLQSLATSLLYGARVDAALLDEAARTINKQVAARADFDPASARTYAPVTAYHHLRYPGKSGHPAPAAPAKP